MFKKSRLQSLEILHEKLQVNVSYLQTKLTLDYLLIHIANTVGVFGPNWTRLDHIGPNWTKLDQLGQIEPKNK